eukprot:2339400-Prymnesium_polylepis.2
MWDDGFRLDVGSRFVYHLLKCLKFKGCSRWGRVRAVAARVGRVAHACITSRDSKFFISVRAPCIGRRKTRQFSDRSFGVSARRRARKGAARQRDDRQIVG